MKKIFLSIAILATFLNAHVNSLSVSQLEKLMKAGVKIIDIRMPKELNKTGVIPTSYKLNFYEKNEKINRDKWLNAFVRIVKNRQLKFVLISKDGEHAKLGVNLLQDIKGYKNAYYLDGGINSWIKSKKKLIK